MRFIIILILSLFLLEFGRAETMLWQVHKGERQLFIAGTVHMLSESDYPLPEEYERAYAQSKILVFETDLSKVNDPSFQKKLFRAASYQDGRTLKSVLNTETYAALEQYCREIGFPIASITQFKPGMVSMTLAMLEVQRLGLAGIGVDQFFYERARRDRKDVAGLEGVEDQLNFIAHMGEGQENELILNTMKEVRETSKLIGEMKSAWRSGQLKKMETLTVSPMKKTYPKLYQMLLVDRNEAWLPQITHFLSTPEVEMVLVGSAHLVGTEGLLEQLRERGYEVKQF